ncbi:MAG: hypothetical protein COA33_013680 [Fluviicola sp.]|nr:hypothetical protein [Fluviicola sp.]
MKKVAFIWFALVASLSFGQNKTVILDEKFDNNSNNWEIARTADFSCSIKNGKYVLKNFTGNYSYFVLPLDYDITKEFTVEFQLNYSSREGLVYAISNFKSTKDVMYGMGIDGGFSKAIYFGGKPMSGSKIYGYRANMDKFNSSKRTVNFKIESKIVSGPSNSMAMTFYLDGVEAGEQPGIKIDTTYRKLCIVLSGKSEVEIDYIKVSGSEVDNTPEAVEVPNFMALSTSPVGSQPVAPSEIQTIKAGDPIYAKIFMNEDFSESAGGGYKLKIREMIYVDGENVSKYEWNMASSDVSKQGKVFDVPMAPSISNLKYAEEAYILTRQLVLLEPGIHNVKLVIAYQKIGLSLANTLGEVEFKFDNTSAAGRSKFVKMVAAYRAKKLKNVKLPTALMSNSAAEASIKQAIIDAGWVQTPIKVIILERAWRPVKDKFYGNILQREINVAVVTKDKNGFCTIFYPSIYQEYLEGGKYSSTSTLGGIWKLEKDIDCGNVN